MTIEASATIDNPIAIPAPILTDGLGSLVATGCASDAEPVSDSIVDCVSFIASLPTLTVPSAIVLGLSILLLLFSAQIAQRDSSGRRSEANLQREAFVPVPNPKYKRPNIIRRVLALATSGALGILLGTLIAILIAYSAAFAVITLSRLLGG